MFPSLRDDDVLVVEQVAADAIVPGSVILTEQDGRLTAHRVRSVTRDGDVIGVITRGDNRWEDDPAVGLESVVGLVTGYHRDGGHYSLPRLSLTLSLITRCRVQGAYYLKRVVRSLVQACTEPWSTIRSNRVPSPFLGAG
jgi:hypothetical protein